VPSAPTGMDPRTLRRWFDKLARRDPLLHEELSARLNQRLKAISPRAGLEDAVAEAPSAPLVQAALETIVREGRPALLIKNGKITQEDTVVDELSAEVVAQLLQAAAAIEPIIPLIGRIDVTNFSGPADYIGTGWLIDSDVIVTNRHVADLVARWEGGTYRFRAGRFGDPLEMSIDYRHERGSAASDVSEIERVIWIEPDQRKADIAFLKVKRDADGTSRGRVELAETEASPDADVAVVGYPARAPMRIIPDQAWMDRIYGGFYDVKRIAPGLMGELSRGWATHDCTTLGGNSGSIVVDMRTGKAVALHFAGLYMIENYAVPASVIRSYLRERPWQGAQETPHAAGDAPARPDAVANQAASAQVVVAGGSVTVEVPLIISIALGQPGGKSPGDADVSQPAIAKNIDAAVAAFATANRGGGILAVRPGYVMANGKLTDRECIAVAAHPNLVGTVASRCPSSFAGYPVEVRRASIDDQLGASGEAVIAEAVTSIMYDDDNRTGPNFSFAPVNEEMTVTCCVGPERGWEVLRPFLDKARRELISSMYEFHAEHVSKSVEDALKRDVKMQIVLDPQTRDPKSGNGRPGDFDRSSTFERWADKFGFARIFVPLGSRGLVGKAYHIKVTVRDGNAFWLSSGNWTRTSQPLIATANRHDPRKTGRAGNREWHVTVENKKLAQRFRNHIMADFTASKSLGGREEAVVEEILVDVPMTILEAIELEAAPASVVEALTVKRRVRVKPLLTPDKQGAVFSEAVLDLIASARKQLVFQNQYIDIKGTGGGFLDELVNLLVEKSQELDDFRIILRSGMGTFRENMEELKRRGMPVNDCVRRLANVHTKGIVVDGKRVLIGSQNWSALGVSLNRDASLIFDDEEIADYFLRAFELDWDRASDIGSELEAVAKEEGPRLAVGSAPPPGFVRMSLGEYLER